MTDAELIQALSAKDLPDMITLLGSALRLRLGPPSNPYDNNPVPSNVPGRCEIIDTATGLPLVGALSVAQLATYQLGVVAYDSVTNLPMLASLYTASWASSATGVATVDSSGLVTGVAAGSTTISVQVAANGGQPSASATGSVTVGAAAVATLEVDRITLAVTNGGQGQINYTPKAAGGQALSGRVIVPVSTDTSKATVSQSGNVCTVSGIGLGAATINATCEGIAASAVSITINAPSAFTPHLPAGFNLNDPNCLVTDHDFNNGILGPGWTGQSGYNNQYALVTDVGNPTSGPLVLEGTIGAGHQAGTGLFNISTPNIQARNHSKLYIALYFKYTPSMAHPGFVLDTNSGAQKLIHSWGYSRTNVLSNICMMNTYWNVNPSSAGYYTATIAVQNLCDPVAGAGTNYSKTWSIGTFSLDEWYLYEAYMYYNTGSNADGYFEEWLTPVNPALASRHGVQSALRMTDGANKRWTYLDIDPTTPGNYVPATDMKFRLGRMLVASLA